MKLAGPYYMISGNYGTMHVAPAHIGSLRRVVGDLAECARISPQSGVDSITRGGESLSGMLLTSGNDCWHVLLRVPAPGLDRHTVTCWMSLEELHQLRELLNDHPLPGESLV